MRVRTKRLLTEDQWRAMINNAMPLIIYDIKHGVKVREAIDKHEIGDHIFYKYATRDQKAKVKEAMKSLHKKPATDQYLSCYPVIMDALKAYRKNITRVVLKRNDRINYILSGVSLYYGVPFTQLLVNCKRSEKTMRKQIVVKLLRDVADVSYKEIGNGFGLRPENVYIHYTNINSDIQVNKVLRDEYNAILKHMGL